MDIMKKTLDRRGFLSQAGKTLAAAGGLALIPGVANAATRGADARRSGSPLGADAKTYTCCVEHDLCPVPCERGHASYHCSSAGCESYCTNCREFDYTCFKFTNPSC